MGKGATHFEEARCGAKVRFVSEHRTTCARCRSYLGDRGRALRRLMTDVRRRGQHAKLARRPPQYMIRAGALAGTIMPAGEMPEPKRTTLAARMGIGVAPVAAGADAVRILAEQRREAEASERYGREKKQEETALAYGKEDSP